MEGRYLPGGAVLYAGHKIARYFIIVLNQLRNLLAFLLPVFASKPNMTGLVHPYVPAKGSMQTMPSNILTAFREDILRQLEQETCPTESLGLPLEILVVEGGRDHRGLAILFDAHLLQRACRPRSMRVVLLLRYHRCVVQHIDPAAVDLSYEVRPNLDDLYCSCRFSALDRTSRYRPSLPRRQPARSGIRVSSP